MHTQCFLERNIRYCPLECKENGCLSCGNRRCLTCQQKLSAQTFTFHSTGYIHYICQCILQNQECCKPFSVSVWYAICWQDIQCLCGMQCVGEKEQSFNERMNGHRSDCTSKPYLPIRFRVKQPEHAKADIKNLTIIILDHNEDRSNA